jgi:NitT/TauT family transport system substrate-binding protein
MRAKLALSVVLAIASVALAACGGDDVGVDDGVDLTEPSTENDTGGDVGADGGDADPDAGQLTTIRSTSLPLLDNGPYFYALEEGIFAKHGLEIDDLTTGGGALGIPALIGGDVDMVFSNTISVLLAVSEGLPIRIVAATNENLPESESEEDFVAIVTGPDSGITGPADLEGKRMAVNTLNNINWLYERAWLRQEGVDPDTVEFLEIPFPDQVPALLEGRVDATMIGAPFLQQLLSEGATILGYPYRVSERVLVANYVTTQQYADENPEAVASFRAALEEANSAVDASPDRALDIFEEKTRIERSTLEQVRLPRFVATPDVDVIRSMAELMVEEGLISEVPDLDALILTP